MHFAIERAMGHDRATYKGPVGGLGSAGSWLSIADLRYEVHRQNIFYCSTFFLANKHTGGGIVSAGFKPKSFIRDK
ncbi:UNVERIFIED_CONTAM: hypothetical protein NCL1_26907 [Trichonephila clavipes]